MNWGVIPEIFFDLIGRIVPGSLLMVLVVLIARGYRQGIEDIPKQASQISTAASFFTLIIVAYFVAILMKQLWDFPQRRIWERDQETETERKDREDLQKIYDRIRATGMTETGAPVVSLPDAEIMLRMIQRCLPVEGYRLMKIQAEKGLCETMIPGLLLLAALDVWLLMAAGTWLPERIWLLALLGFSVATFWQWRKGLEGAYRRSLCVLWHLLQTSSAAPHHTDRLVG